MLTGRARRAAGGLLVLTIAGAGPVLAAGQPALADSVRSAQQWVLDAVDAPAAWQLTQGSGVLVAVIDSGVRPDVSDLTGSVTSGPDFSGVGTPTSDANWGMHGTWMASLIAGHGHGPGGTDGISGVAPQAKILSIRVLPDKKDPGYSQYKHESSGRGQRALAEAIRYAVAHHAGVISMSLGYGASSRVVRAALQDATRHGVVVVASSGNSRASAKGDGTAQAPYSFPADYPGVLGVAAVDRSGGPASFSSDNLSVQIAAPGVKVPAQGSDGQYWLVSGTSPACALTAGVAALIKSVYPQLTPVLVIRAITVSAQNQPKQGYDDRVGYGTLDASVALATAGKLTGVGVTGRGISVHSHFGGGPKAIPAAPVGPRGSGQLMLFGGLAVACLIVSLIAAGRLLLYRRRATAAQPAPSYPGAAPPVLAYPTAQPGSVQPGSGRPGPDRPAPAYQATQPPAGPATSWWSQDNGTRPPGPAPTPGWDQPDRMAAGPQPPRAEPHPVPSPLPPAQPLADLASTWWSQDNGTRSPGPGTAPDRGEPDRMTAGPHPPQAGLPPSRSSPPPAVSAADWQSQDNGIRPPGPAPTPGPDQPDRAVVGPQPPRNEPHPSPSSLLPVQPLADPASTWWSQDNGTRPPSPVPSPGRDKPDRTIEGPRPPRAEPPPVPSPPLPALLSADPASTWWSQGNGTRPGSAPSTDRDETDRTVVGPQPSRAELPRTEQRPMGQPHPEPALTEPHPSPSPPPAPQSAWHGPSRPGGARPSSAGTASAAGPGGRAAAGTTGGSGPAGASPSATIPGWPTSARSSGPPAQAPWPGNDDSEDTSPSGIPPVPAEPPAGSPPFAPAPVRPGNASAGAAGSSRYLPGQSRPSPSGPRATQRDHPQPAPAWARNHPPGSQDDEGAEPDSQDEP